MSPRARRRTQLALALLVGAAAAAGCRRADGPEEAAEVESDVEREESPDLAGHGVAGKLFAKALALEATDPAAATEIYVRLTLDHPSDPDCGEGASGGRCAEEARARIDVLACRKARGGRDPAAPSVEALAAQLRAAAAAPAADALAALASCDFWFGACASDSGSADAPSSVVPSLRERIRGSDALEVIEASEDVARLGTKPDAQGRTLELGVTRGEAGWSWDSACESEPPPDTEP
jgi:hypothetical protein